LITDITQLYELSVVWKGADGFAKRLEKPVSNSLIMTPPNPSNKETTVDLKALSKIIGLKKDDPTEDEVNTALVALAASATTQKVEVQTLRTELDVVKATNVELQTKVTSLNGNVATLTTELATAKVGDASLAKNAELGKAFIEKQRTEAARLYALVEGTDANPAMLEMLKTADLPIVDSFVTSYSKRAEQIAPLTCSGCKKQFQKSDPNAPTRRSSEQNKEQAEEKGKTTLTATSEDARLKDRVTSIHGE
jgi:hypothetical protein